MAINLITEPTAGAPLGVADYNHQNALQQALHGMGSHNDVLTEWETTTQPKIALGARFVHDGGNYECQAADEVIAGAPAEGHVYIKITEALGVLTASFVTSDAGYTFNPIKGGWYHADGTQLLPFILLLYSTSLWKKTRAILPNLNETSDLSSCQIYPWAGMETIVQDDSQDSLPVPAGATYLGFDSPNLANNAGITPYQRHNFEWRNYLDAGAKYTFQGVCLCNGGFALYLNTNGNERSIYFRLRPGFAYDTALTVFILDSMSFSGALTDFFTFIYDQITDKLMFYIWDDVGNRITITSNAFVANPALRTWHDILLRWKKGDNDADFWLNNVRQGGGVEGTKTITGAGITNINITSTTLAIGCETQYTGGPSNFAQSLFYIKDLMILNTSGTTYLSNYNGGASTKPYYLPTWYPGYKHSSLIDNNGNAGFNQLCTEKLIAGSIDIGAGQIKMKKIPIGVWNMDTTATLSIAHNLTGLKLVNWCVVVISDAGSPFFINNIYDTTGNAEGGILGNGTTIATSIVLMRSAGTTFDSASFDDATMNRGYIYLWYEV
jgi:hypothetical protein